MVDGRRFIHLIHMHSPIKVDGLRANNFDSSTNVIKSDQASNWHAGKLRPSADWKYDVLHIERDRNHGRIRI